MKVDEMASYIPFEEPGPVTILIQSSFLLLINVVNYIFNKLIYCGLVGEILIGVAWGTPGGNWLSSNAQHVFMELGYLGLLLMVYEGGLTTSFQILKRNFHYAFVIAATGVCIPMGVSFSILGFSNATPVAAFAAGCALCVTSLGSSFAILVTSGFKETRVGVILTSAAVLDDIVGLVMIKIIGNLGSGSFTAISVIRPVFVSIALIVILMLVYKFAVFPFAVWFRKKKEKFPAQLRDFLTSSMYYFVLHTLVLVGLITATTYAGASNLTAAYVFGAANGWLDEEYLALIQNSKGDSNSIGEYRETNSNLSSISINYPKKEEVCTPSKLGQLLTAKEVFEIYYGEILNKVLQPLFFASVGFSIPITQMFIGRLIWRGIIYALLMMFSKFLCGLWLIRLKILKGNKRKISLHNTYYPALMIGFAMTPRGEIGFLISSLAESNGVFSNNKTLTGSSDVYIIVTWAIVFCTFFGPICVGFVLRKVKKIITIDEKSNPLGRWS